MSIASPGFVFFVVNITLPATQNSQLQAFIEAPQNLDLKIVGGNCVCTGNWSLLWGNNVSDFSIENPNNLQGFIGYQNLFGIGPLPHRWMEKDANGNVIYDYSPIFPQSSIINLLFRNDTAAVNSIEIGLEGIYGDFIL